ncbi:MAG: hypothetical protein R3Y07_02005 [Eubacteriales bacterium]
MNIWELLDTPYTDDKKLIKKAYARQVARYHPEEFPQEFQAIHAAYLSALAIAERSHKLPSPQPDEHSLPDPSDLVDFAPHPPTNQSPFEAQPLSFEEEFARTAQATNAQEPIDTFQIPFDDMAATFDKIIENSEILEDYSTQLLKELKNLPLIYKHYNTKHRKEVKEVWNQFFQSEAFFFYTSHWEFRSTFLRYLFTTYGASKYSISFFYKTLSENAKTFPPDVARPVHELLSSLKRWRPRRKSGMLPYIIYILLLILLLFPDMASYDLSQLFN